MRKWIYQTGKIFDFADGGIVPPMKTLFMIKPTKLNFKDHGKGKRKQKRYLPRNKPVHLILKSRYILLTHRHWIEEKIQAYAKKFGVKIHKHALCADHIHFAVQFSHPDMYKRFVRSLTGVIARTMGKGMWRLLPLTKVVNHRKYFQNLLAYIQRNHDELWMLCKYKPRKYSKKDRERLGPPATLSPCVTNALS